MEQGAKGKMKHYALCALLSAEVSLAVDFRLYLITDRHLTRIPLPEAIQQALLGGVRAVQVREKDLPVRELLALAQELRRMTREIDAKLFINDRVDVAVAVGADGVHLGHQSMPAEAVRKIVGKKMLIGVSTHSLAEAVNAEKAGADFITFGPIFVTPSKMQYGAPVGVEALGTIKEHIRIPVFGLGGIRFDSILQVLQAGADGIATISAILAADDIHKAAELMNQRIAEVVK
jgi:thiamine-phosphate pyrophosphorylase